VLTGVGCGGAASPEATVELVQQFRQLGNLAGVELPVDFVALVGALCSRLWGPATGRASLLGPLVGQVLAMLRSGVAPVALAHLLRRLASDARA
jgi:hypothetical protein